MRLKEVKLVGFKSFVDPTTVVLPGNRNAVVGPNGCGKSNIVDAVRWVMGESSARQLRGEALTDVIFNGATSRQPTSLASVELVFDNRDGRVGGKFAAYAEIAIRRQVGRDSQSIYTLNGVRCRRRDIADVFLGTGFGPRSYSIIEQGMISELVEAKPDALRAYLEEAAGVSKYKERRRETQNRIRHAEENLARLADIRDDLERRLAHLKRQAKAAERYRTLKAEERTRKAQLLAIRIAAVNERLRECDGAARELEVRLEKARSEHQALQTKVEERRAEHGEQTDAFAETERAKYEVDAAASQLEQAIGFDRRRIGELRAELQTLEGKQRETGIQLEADVRRVADIKRQLKEKQPRLASGEAAKQAAAERLEAAEAHVRSCQREWEEHAGRVNANASERSLCEERGAGATEAVERLRVRLAKLAEDATPEVDADLSGVAEELAQAKRELAVLDAALASNATALTTARNETAQAEQALDAVRAEAEKQRHQLAEVAAVQRSALGRENGAESEASRWLGRAGLRDAPRLGERLQVKAGWERAVEAVLGTDVQAIVVENLDEHAAALDELAQGRIALVEAGAAQPNAKGELPLLTAFVSGDLGTFAEGVHAAESLASALQHRPSLRPGESIVTRDGVYLGKDWIRVQRSADESAGVIERGRELEALEEAWQEARRRLGDAQAHVAAKRDAAAAAEQERDSLRSRQANAAAQCSDLQTKHDVLRVRIDEAVAAAQRRAAEEAYLRTQIEAESKRLRQSRERLETLAAEAERLATVDATLRGQRQRHDAAAEEARGEARRATEAFHQLVTECSTFQALQKEAEDAHARLLKQRVELADRGDQVRAGIAEIEAAIPAKESARDQKLAASKVHERKQRVLRTALDQLEANIRELVQRGMEAGSKVEEARSRLEEAHLERKGLATNREHLNGQLADTGIALDEARRDLPESATEAQWEEALAALARRIERLGAINLAAIDEYKTESERKAELDRQHEDVETALATLKGAIERIDRETRTRFKETFNRVNEHLKTLFPKVFGGGHAALELTGSDWLETGVTLMARPPGKRNSSIHLLSGGEKAMSAVALIFSIFQLNPSPVCLLDEVDAPLDDSNVERFAELIREMSRDVQFVVVTHNKQTIEMADYLLGVTMQEAGVSRLVSVDVDKAARMAAAG